MAAQPDNIMMLMMLVLPVATEVCAPVLAKFGFATDQGGLMEYMKAGRAAGTSAAPPYSSGVVCGSTDNVSFPVCYPHTSVELVLVLVARGKMTDHQTQALRQPHRRMHCLRRAPCAPACMSHKDDEEIVALGKVGPGR